VSVGRLSAGQRRRTSLACLLARRPELWLLDEPHAGLDHETRDQLDDLIGRAVEQGATVLIASHELDRAESLAHRVVELAGGMTVAAARPAPGVPPAEMPVSRTQEREAPSPSTSPPEVSHVA
jgi:ABC-type multidrug transport system ATPase subunit